MDQNTLTPRRKSNTAINRAGRSQSVQQNTTITPGTKVPAANRTKKVLADNRIKKMSAALSQTSVGDVNTEAGAANPNVRPPIRRKVNVKDSTTKVPTSTRQNQSSLGQNNRSSQVPTYGAARKNIATNNTNTKKVIKNPTQMTAIKRTPAPARSASQMQKRPPMLRWGSRQLPEMNEANVLQKHRTSVTSGVPSFQSTPVSEDDYDAVLPRQSQIPVKFPDGHVELAYIVPNGGGGLNSCFFMSTVPCRVLSYLYNNKNMKGVGSWNNVQDPARAFMINELGKVLITPGFNDPHINEIKSYAISAIEQDTGPLDERKLTQQQKNELKNLQNQITMHRIAMTKYIADNYFELCESYAEDRYLDNKQRMLVSVNSFLGFELSLGDINGSFATVCNNIANLKGLDIDQAKKDFIRYVFTTEIDSCQELLYFCNAYLNLWNDNNVQMYWNDIHKCNAQIFDKFYGSKAQDYLNKWGKSGVLFEFHHINGSSLSLFGALLKKNIVMVASDVFNNNHTQPGQMISFYYTPQATATVVIGYRPGHYTKLLTASQIYHFLLARGKNKVEYMQSLEKFTGYLQNGGQLPKLNGI